MRTDEEIRANQAKYERMLDEAFGLAPRQEPVTPVQPLTPNPTPMAHMTPFEDVYGALTADPEAIAVFREGWDDTLKPVDIGPMPGDAFSQLRWYNLRDLSRHHHTRHKTDFEDAKKYRTLQRVQSILRKLSQHDPWFPLTMDLMRFHVEGLPGSARRSVERMFERCPHEVVDFYREMREAAWEALRAHHERCGHPSK